MSTFRTGKLPSGILVSKVFRYKGKKDPAVILGSSIGEDAALVSFGAQVLVLKTDPVTGTSSGLGWLAVHINANDIACRGARPRWFLSDVLLPEKSGPRMIQMIMRDIDRAAKQVGVAVVGGHTEVTPELKRPIVVGYMIGTVAKNRYVTSSGARPGDHIIMTKTAGIEGTAVLASDFGPRLRPNIGTKGVEKAKRMIGSISIVEDASCAADVGGVRAMHDPTEGGLMQGLWELAEASKVGFLAFDARIPVLAVTEQICSILKVNPLRLMSSGCLLIAADPKRSTRILHRLRKRGIYASLIGTFTVPSRGRKLVYSDGRVETVRPSERDELYRIIETRP